MKRPALQRIALLLAAAVGSSAHAAVYTVGTGTGCTHGTIQSAIDAAQNSAGADTVRITRSLTYNAAPVSIDTGQELTLEGGYATCTQSSADTTRTVLSGGGTAAQIVHMSVDTGGVVHLRKLELRDATSAFIYGGGIYFDGDGILEVSDSFITNNHARYGGGIYAHGTGSNAELVIGANVTISNNIADANGGGIYAHEIEMSMVEPGSILLLNHAVGVGGAGGYGGGLFIHAGNRSSYAYVGTGGVADFGAIALNTARYGGGVALGGENDNHGTTEHSELHLFTTDAEHRGKIFGNSASIAGGAIHAMSSDGGTFDGNVLAGAKLWNAVLDGNDAPNGAAVYLAGYISSFGFNVEDAYTPWPADAVHCNAGGECGSITNNVTAASGGGYTDGAILEGSSADYRLFSLGCSPADCALPEGGIVVEGNRGGRLVDSSSSQIGLVDVLIDGNTFSHELVRGSHLIIRDATLSGNSIGADVLLSSNSNVEIKRSLLWQPGLVMLQHSGTMAVDHVIASEIDSLGGNFGGGGDCGGGVCAILADPQFVDPAHGDYGLRVSSPAIDMAAAISGDDRDASGRPRDQNLPHTFADNGVRDLGAFERQSLQPMVLNGDFDFSDLRLWTWFGGEWDGAQNTAGGSASGSWHFSTSGLTYRDVNVGEQCVRLPGPGRYLMNGWGKGGGSTMITRDYAVLAWEYRRNGGTDCSIGAADASGELTLGGGTNWGHPAQPAAVDVPEADFVAGGPSIKLRLIARDGSTTNVGGPISAWFDGITLDAEQGDVIFADGFE